MDEEDELALKLINGKMPAGQEPCSEDQFEEVMNFFEETAQTRQPFAAVDSPPVLPLEELQDQIDDTVSSFVRNLSRFLYEHWSTRRTATGNRSLAPRLKFETGQETDDSDPYVCFRRRELRQIRKTRNRDAQSAEKLRKLRLELETARGMLLMVKRRETLRKESLEMDRLVFEQRSALRETKRKLGVKGDEELLINQKVKPNPVSKQEPHLPISQKQKVLQGMTPNQAAIAQQLRMPMAAGFGPELRTLEDVSATRERDIQREIQTNIEKHIRWNEGFVDKTLAPLVPNLENDYPSPSEHFREAMAATEYLPTPPASISDEESQPNGTDVVMKDVSRPSTPFRYASPADEDTVSQMPSFRRRIGRGGRIMIDRRLPRARKESSKDDWRNDAWRYDSPDEDDLSDEDRTFPDLTFARMSQRAYLIGSSRPSENSQLVAARRQSENAGPSHSSPVGSHTQQTPAPS